MLLKKSHLTLQPPSLDSHESCLHAMQIKPSFILVCLGLFLIFYFPSSLSLILPIEQASKPQAVAHSSILDSADGLGISWVSI